MAGQAGATERWTEGARPGHEQAQGSQQRRAEPSGLLRGRRPLVAATALIAVALLPVLVAVVTRWGRNYLPVQDSALIDLRVRDVWSWSPNFPLVGPYSRYHWDHPGPMLFWLVAPFSGLTGGRAWATQVGCILLQGMATAWLGVVAWRHRGLEAAAVWLAVLTLGYAAIGTWIFLEPWGPHVTFPFFPLFLCLIWLVRRDDLRTLPQAVVVGSFLVQTHVGYAPLVAAGGLFVLPELWRAASPLRAFVRAPAIKWSLGLAVVLWFPVLLDTLIHWPGNLVDIVRKTIVHPQDTVAGPITGLRLLADEFRPLPAWLGGHRPDNSFTGTAQSAPAAYLLVAIALLTLGFVAAKRTGRIDDRRMVMLAALLLVVSAVALSGVEGTAVGYLFYWRYIIASFVVLASAWSIAHWAAVRVRAASALFVGACIMAVLVRSIFSAHALANAASAIDRDEQPTRELVAQIERAGLPRRPVLIRTAGSALGGVAGGILDALDRKGVSIRADRSQRFQIGDSRTAKPSQVSAIWYVTEESEQLSILSALPHASVIAQTHPLSPPDQLELTRLQRNLARQLKADKRSDLITALGNPYVQLQLARVTGIDPQDLERLGALNNKVARHTCDCGVVAIPSSNHRGGAR